MEVFPQSWSDIRERYELLGPDSEFGAEMIKLVTHIEQSSVGKTLHPWSSMFDLRITQTQSSPFEGDVPFLLIKVQQPGKVEFRFIDTPFVNKQWSRIVDEKQVIEMFDKFIDQLHWTTRSGGSDKS